ncbi:YchJ family metal-binding protein [Opitutus sp. ER46]|uniref:YchJ family protein n=1 Tax=Opitutus sp. ER46 TaxID=2161864 RepID=UPI000D31E000|nr:YchJ family metal-binding protein [Opitutus sp. ER46]PTX97953.1 hypothetical protein DB354_06670 [Opitutus sp. ER46]
MNTKNRRVASGAPCPCGSGRPFGACCGALLDGQREAASARELMRSRYTAHVLGDEPYLHRTYAKTADQPFVAGQHASPGVDWVRLVIHEDAPGRRPDQAFVEFSAFYRDRQGTHEMRERSEFRLVGGRWLYWDGALRKEG